MTADLLAVLREAREALRSCAWSTELRTDDALMAMATADAKIGEATMMLTVSALRAHEAQGWDRSRYGYNRLYRAISGAVRPDWESRTLHISVERFEDMMEAREGGANVVLHETPPPPEPQQ